MKCDVVENSHDALERIEVTGEADGNLQLVHGG